MGNFKRGCYRQNTNFTVAFTLTRNMFCFILIGYRTERAPETL
jgi:hypothetical protein